jgi:hypothetical protein
VFGVPGVVLPAAPGAALPRRRAAAPSTGQRPEELRGAVPAPREERGPLLPHRQDVYLHDVRRHGPPGPPHRAAFKGGGPGEGIHRNYK